MKLKIRARTIICIELCTITLTHYMLRTNLNSLMNSMVTKPKDHNDTGAKDCPQNFKNFTKINKTLGNYGPRYNWNFDERRIIRFGFPVGYVIAGLPAGFLADRYGSKKLVVFSLATSGLATMLTPLMAAMSYVAMTAIRFIVALLCGPLYPALFAVITRWAPKNERGLFIAATFAGQLGASLTWIAMPGIIASMGWIFGFIIPGALTILVGVLWFFTGSDSPTTFKWITEEEKNYIINDLKDVVDFENRRVPPLEEICRSFSVWVLIILHFGSVWGLYMVLTGGTKYMHRTLGFNMQEAGVLASLPTFARFLFGLLFGILGDFLRTREKFMSVVASRRMYTVFSHIIPAGLLFSVMAMGCHAAGATTLVTLAVGLNGAAVVTVYQNIFDLGPNYVGTVFGLMNSIAHMSGVFAPLVISALTSKNFGFKEWRNVFNLGASVYLATGLIFIMFGKGVVQPFNEKSGVKRIPEERYVVPHYNA